MSRKCATCLLRIPDHGGDRTVSASLFELQVEVGGRCRYLPSKRRSLSASRMRLKSGLSGTARRVAQQFGLSASTVQMSIFAIWSAGRKAAASQLFARWVWTRSTWARKPEVLHRGKQSWYQVVVVPDRIERKRPWTSSWKKRLSPFSAVRYRRPVWICGIRSVKA